MLPAMVYLCLRSAAASLGHPTASNLKTTADNLKGACKLNRYACLSQTALSSGDSRFLRPIIVISSTRRSILHDFSKASMFSTAVSASFQHGNHPTSFFAALDALIHTHHTPKISNKHLVFPWDLMISIYLRSRFHQNSLRNSKTEVVEGIQTALSKAGGFDCDLILGSSLIWMYVNARDVVRARKLFDVMPERDADTYNPMILGYASRGMWTSVSEIVRCIPENWRANTVTWNTVIAGYLHTGNPQEALRLISQMTTSGSSPDPVTLILGSNACHSLRRGMAMHGLAIRKIYIELQQVMCALISMYVRCDEICCAHVLYRKTACERWATWADSISYNSVIKFEALNTWIDGYSYKNIACGKWVNWKAVCAAFVRAGRRDEALEVLKYMGWYGSKPGIETLRVIIPICRRYGSFEKIREVHGFMLRHGHDYTDRFGLWELLAEMYGMEMYRNRVLYTITNEDYYLEDNTDLWDDH